MKFLNAFAIVAAFGLANVASAQSQPRETDGDATSLSARWVSSIVGMSVTTPAGARLGTVKNVVVDGYGRASYAVIAYAGMMGLGNKYTAIPWTSVAAMLHSDRLLMDQSQLENAPVLAGAKPESANTPWRRAADTYWRGKLALGPASMTMPAALQASDSAPSSEAPSRLASRCRCSPSQCAQGAGAPSAWRLAP
jgi:sporulation protein YlmC with PRC-barrel domain